MQQNEKHEEKNIKLLVYLKWFVHVLYGHCSHAQMAGLKRPQVTGRPSRGTSCVVVLSHTAQTRDDCMVPVKSVLKCRRNLLSISLAINKVFCLSVTAITLVLLLQMLWPPVVRRSRKDIRRVLWDYWAAKKDKKSNHKMIYFLWYSYDLCNNLFYKDSRNSDVM